MEVGPRTLRRWMRDAGITNTHNVVIANLRGSASSLQLNSDAGRKQTAKFLADHDTDIVILDPLAPLLATLGLDENSNADVAQFFAWWSETLALAGVTDDLVVHHTGHAGDRSRGASRLLDEPDAIWTLTRGKDIDPTPEDVYGQTAPRYLGAYGRDVDLAPTMLKFDSTTRQLLLTDRLKGAPATDQENADTYRDKILQHLRTNQPLSASQLSDTKFVSARQDLVQSALNHMVKTGEVAEAGKVNRGGRFVETYCIDVPNRATGTTGTAGTVPVA